MTTASFRVAIIGHTGRGNYGHGLDMAFVGIEGADARMHLEWAMAAHASHMAGARVYLPLDTTDNPFDTWS